MTNLNRLLLTLILTVVSTTIAWAVDQPNISFDSSTKTYTISCGTDGATISYTVDGTDPTTSSKRSKYTKPFQVNRTLTVWAAAEKNGEWSSVSQRWQESVDSRFLNNNIYYQLVANTLDDIVEVSPRQTGAYEGDITIPSTVDYAGKHYTVVRIGYQAFNNADNMTSISLPNTITSIGKNAFDNCDKLYDITLPSSVRTIEESAFTYCYNLKNVSLNEGLETIGYQAFYNCCYALTSITLPSTLKSIGYEAFRYCTKLKTISIPDGVTSIDRGLFGGCSSLVSVKLPTSLAAIPNEMFYDCRSLSSIQIPSTVKSIGESAFRNCDALTSVTIPVGVETLGNEVFFDCNNLLSVSIPEGVTVIPNGAFDDDYALSTVSLPSTLTTIGERAFNTCRSLTTITIPEHVASIRKYAFTECDKLTSVYCLPTTPPEMSADNDGNAFSDALQRATLYVKAAALNNYTSSPRWDEFQTKRTIDHVLCEQPTFALADYVLTMSTATAGATIYYTIDGSDPTTASTVYTGPILFMQNGTVRAIAVKDGMENSAVSEFVKSNYMVPVPVATMDENFVMNITCESPNIEGFPETQIYYILGTGNYTYDLSDSRWELYDGQPIQLTRPQYVCVYATRDGWNTSEQKTYDFYGAYYTSTPYIEWISSKSKIRIYNYDADATVYYTLDGTDPTAESAVYNPDDSIAINRDVIIKCVAMRPGHFNSDITEQTISGVAQTFYEGGFYYRLRDNMLADEVEVTRADNHQYQGDVVIKRYVDHNGMRFAVTRIGNNAFYDNDKVTSVTLHDGINSIGVSAFQECEALTAMDVPSSVKSIEREAFRNCTNLRTVSLHEGLETIGEAVFRNCYNIPSLTLPSTLKTIGNGTFDGCRGFNELRIPDGVTSIGSQAFMGCTSLVSIHLPAALSVISDNLFYGCSSLLTIDIPAKVKTIEGYAFYNCDALISVSLPASLETLGENAFGSCDRLLSVTIPEGVTLIPNYAFDGCSALTTVSLPTSLRTIGYRSFISCSSMETFTIPENVETIGVEAFRDCNNLSNVYCMGLTPPTLDGENGNQAFVNVATHASLHVRKAAEGNYKVARHWNKFNSIEVFDNMMVAQPAFHLENYKLSISTSTDGATIYYTTDGTDPTTASTKYTTPINFWKNGTVKAIAVKDGMDNSLVGEFKKEDMKVAKPVVTMDADFKVTMTCFQPDIAGFPEVRIYYVVNDNSYTIDASDERWQLYDGNPIQLTRPSYVHYYAEREGWISSEQAYENFYDAYYTNTPSIEWNSYTQKAYIYYYENYYTGSTVYYTLDGSDPTRESLVYNPSDSIPIARNLLVKAFAVKPGHFDSDIATRQIYDVTQTFSKDGIYYRLVDNVLTNEVEVTRGNKDYEGDIVIPEKLTYAGVEYSVTRIGREAFYNQGKLKSIVMPNTIKSVGENAFLYCSNLTEIDIPASVITIENSAFSSSGLRKITFHDGLETIGKNAFYYTQFTSITLPQTLKSIGEEAFYNCNQFANLDIPESVNYIGARAFIGCDKLESVKLPSVLTELSDGIFQYNSRLKSIVIPAGVTTIGTSAFYGCNGLSSVTIPASVQTIKKEAFSSCRSLTSVSIPEGVTAIENYTFRDCDLLMTVQLPSTLTSIGSNAFENCKSMPNVTLPENLKTIDTYAFKGCTALTSVYSLATTPPTLNGDGSTNAFATVMGDATLYSKAEVKDAYENANHWSSFKTLAVFENVPCAQPTFTLENFRLTMKSNTEGATIYYTTDDSEPTTQSLKYTAPIPLLQNDTIRAIAVAEGYSPSVVSDFRKADYKMDVPTVSLSDDLVMTITYGGATEGLTPVHIYYRENTSNSYWYEKPWVLYEGPVQLTKPRYYRVMAQRDGWLDSDESETYDYNTDYRLDAPQMRWTKDETTGIGTMTLSYYSNNSEGDFYYTLDGTEPTKENGTLYTEPIQIVRNLTVKAVAWKEKHFYSEVSSYNVTNVSRTFFVDNVWYRLTDDSQADEVEVTNGNVAYEGDVNIPATVTIQGTKYDVVGIGKSALYDQDKVTSITLPASIRYIGERAFYDADKLQTIDVPEKVKSIGNYAFYNCDVLTTVILHEGIETIGEHAFYSMPALKTIVIPSTVTCIGNGAFASCSSLTSATLPAGLKNIPDELFRSDRQLADITLPTAPETIGQYAFSETAITTMQLPATVTQMGEGVFNTCHQLTNMVIPEGITELGKSLFANCPVLTSVVLPNTLQRVGRESFYNCPSIESIVLPASLKTIGSGAFYDCTKLMSVYSQATTPATIEGDPNSYSSYEKDAFNTVKTKATLFVPETAVDAYKNKQFWQDFGDRIVGSNQIPCQQPTYELADFKLTIQSLTDGASIYYTNDGSNPDANAIPYTAPINLVKNDTIRAIAVKDGMAASPVAQFYKNDYKVSAPVVTLSDDFVVTITCETPDVAGLPETKIYYTQNRSSYDAGENWTLYQKPFKMLTAGYIHVRAVREGWIESEMIHNNYYTNYYLEKPSIYPYYSSISYMPADTTITLSHSQENAQIYYTLDGSDPNVNGVLYTGPIKPEHNVNVVAIAKREGAINSDPEQREFNWFTIPTPTITIEHLAAVMKVEKPVYAKIYYTLDNTTPTEESTLYTEPVALNKDCKIKAIAVADKWNDSSVGTFNSTTGFVKKDYTVKTPAFGSRQVTDGIMVENADSVLLITTATEGATIHYTLDGTAPTVNSPKYENGIKLTENCTVKAFAVKEDMFSSEVIEAEVEWFRVKQPHIAFNGKYVEMSDDTEDAIIYYTIDGTDPDTKSRSYQKPFALDAEETSVRAIAVKENWKSSEVSRLTYNPGKNYCEAPGITRVGNTNKVQMTTRTAGAKIYYTSDGLNPTVNSNAYTAEVVLTENCTLKAMAVDSLLYDSEVSTFVVDWFKANQPVITTDGIFVTITAPEENARVYYTLDGSDPTTSSTLYEGTLTMKGSCTIKAIAAFDNFNNSSVAVFNYYASDYTCGLPTFTRNGNLVSIVSAPAEGTTIYYTTDGTTPTTASNVFTMPIEVSQNGVVKAMAVNAKLFTSEIAEYEVNWFKVDAPEIAFDGIFASMTCVTPNSRIYYTVDGSSPTAESFLYTGVVTMTGSCTVKAMAMRDNFNNSAVTAISFDKASNTVSTPVFTKSGNSVSIKVTQAESSTIYYTLDGTTPTDESAVYTEPILMTENGVLKAMAMNPKLFTSEIADFDVDWFKVETPVMTLVGNTVTMSCATPDAVIYYDFDEAPTTKSEVYSGAVTLTDNRMVFAMAVKKNFHDSEVASVAPDVFACVSPTFSYNGRYLQIQAGEGMTVHYTTDGTKPTETSEICEGQIEINELCTVRAISTRRDFRDSPEAAFTVAYLYDGEEASLNEAGHLEDVFQWIGGTGHVETLAVNGKLNEKDLAFIRGISSLKHLDLTEASYEGDCLPDEAFANLPLISFSSPKQLSTVGSHLFKGCSQLAAVVWNANIAMPENVIEDVKNPNFLLYVNSHIYTPSSYKGNLISGGQATSITLSDSETSGNFYCPQRFYVQRISYTHNYQQTTESGVTRGWETLALPFDVETITHEKRGALAPFAKGEDITKYKPFWLYELKETGFDRSADIKAYTPYILSMPNNPEYADDYNLAGNVTFTANNTYIETDTAKVTMKGSVKFTPTMLRQEQNVDVLAINLTDYTAPDGTFYENGSAFISDMREVRPFEAYALVNSASRALDLSDYLWGELSDIRSAEMKELEAIGMKRGIYDLSGRRLSNDSSILKKNRQQHQRVYIINGKKTLVK